MNLPSFFNQFSSHLSWIKDKTIYLVRAGSHSYGTNIEGSDTDYKGICIPPKQYYLGCQNKFEQAELHDPDTVIYEITKFFRLAADNNPNCLEALFVDPEDIIYCNFLGAKLLDSRDLFLSKRIKFTMSGYAISQLKRIKLHKRYLLNPPKTPPSRADLGLPEQTLIPQDQFMAAQAEIQKELDKFQFDFMDALDESTKINIRATVSEMMTELKISSEDHWMAAARKIGLSDNFIELMKKERQYASAKKEWHQYQEWKKNRNPARYVLEEKYHYDCKHAYHLVRLLRQCKEALLTGRLVVKRADREELIAIRNGAWTYDELLAFAEKEEKELNELYNSSTALPKHPDRAKLENLCIELVEESLKG